MAKPCTKLTENQRLFCEEWLIHRNGTLAYKTVYATVKKDNTAAVNANRLLRKAKIQAYIDARKAAMAKELEITPEKILKSYARRAFFDPRQLTDPETGNVIPLHRLPKNVAAAVTEIHVKQLKVETDDDGNQVKTELVRLKWDNGDNARDALAKYRGLFEKDNDQKQPHVEIYNQVRAEVEKEMVDEALTKVEIQQRDPDEPGLAE